MDIAGIIRAMPDPVRRGVLSLVNGNAPVRHYLSKKIINKYAYSAPIRPRPFSMAGEFTSWPGLTDRQYSGRHLGECPQDEAPARPDIDAVANLFVRERFRPATDTNLLFALFAQWFVDGFIRTKWEPGPERFFRHNESNHEIDLCQVYGVSEVQTTMLRAGEGGRLRSQLIGGEEYPAFLFERHEGGVRLDPRYARQAEVDENTPAVPGLYTPQNFARVYGRWPDEERAHAFAVGLEHGNSTLGHTLMNTLFLREHNRTAGILQRAHPDWSDERLFQTARNTTITVLLNIVIGDYIVHIAPIPFKLTARPGMAERERWYRTNWIPVEFALLYRWHDLIPDKLTLKGEDIPAEAFRLANRWILRHGLDAVILAAAQERAGRIGLGNTARFLVDKEGADVKRLSIAMDRACRLPSFNAYRRHFGLKPYATFEALTRDRDAAARLRALYGDVERLEWFVGMFAEGYEAPEMMGELMVTMVANDAFTQALTNPLLAEAVHSPATFGPEGYRIVQETHTLAEVIARNTKIPDPGAVGFELPEVRH
jgi:prostaglandin-endoperoxide synthase 2